MIYTAQRGSIDGQDWDGLVLRDLAMRVPPKMKRRALPRPGFCFTELSLSDAELEQLCAIPSRVPSVPRAFPSPLALAAPRRNRLVRRPARLAMVAGLASLALPSCTALAPPTLVEATAEVVQLASAAFSVQKWVLVSAAQPAAAAPAGLPGRDRVPEVSVRPGLAPVADGGLLRADRALSAGQYRAALAIYRELIRRQPSRVEALFGAALASHELKMIRGSAVYLERTLSLRPDHPLGNVLAGFADQLSGRYEQARARYTRFLSVEATGDQADEIRAVLATMPQTGGAPVAAAR